MAKAIMTRTREAIYNEFAAWIPGKNKAEKMAIIRGCTYTGKSDPGEWSPTAAVVIHTETGIPNPEFDETPGFQIIEGWVRVSNEIDTHYCEAYSGAAMCVYEV